MPEDLSAGQRRSLVRDILINKHYSHHPLVESIDVDSVHEHIEVADSKSFLTVQEALYTEYAATVGADTWVSKDPSIWDYLEELRTYYDELAVVYLVRDARDVALSFKTSNVGPYHPYFTAKRWADEQALGIDLLETEFNSQMQLIQYEHLLETPETVIKALCSFLGLSYEPEMLYYYDTEGAQRASEGAEALENLSVPIQSDNYGKFRDDLTGRELKLVEHLAEVELEYFNYELATSEDERESVTVDPELYQREDRDRARVAAFQEWRDHTHEQLRRFASSSMSVGMILRYGLLQ